MSEHLTATIANALAMSYGSHTHAPKGGRDWKAAEDLVPVIDAEIRKARAAAFDSGYDAGWSDRNSSSTTGVYPSDTYRSERANPYRERTGDA